METTSTKNYGVFTDISKGINSALGDTTGRTVSRRTAHGFKVMTSSNNMHDDSAEFIVHMAMIGAVLGGTMATSNKGRNVVILVIFLLVLLFICYHLGKEDERPARISPAR